MEQQGVKVPPMDHYVYRTLPPGAPLPWDHLIGPLPKATLVKHAHEAAALMAPGPAVARTPPGAILAFPVGAAAGR